MSASYLIGPIGESDLELDIERLAAALSHQWPDIEIDEQAPSSPLTWVLCVGDYPVMSGGVGADGQMVFVEATALYAAKFAVWYRTFVPPQYPLFIYDKQGGDPLELRPETAESEIVAALGR